MVEIRVHVLHKTVLEKTKTNNVAVAVGSPLSTQQNAFEVSSLQTTWLLSLSRPDQMTI